MILRLDIRFSPVSIVAGILVAASGPVLADLSIPRPSFGVPEFAQPGGTFRIEARAAAALDSNQWSVVLANDLRAWTGAVEQVDYGLFTDNDTATGYRLTVRLPSDISPEVFQLAISHPDAGAATNVNAVGVVPDFEDDFYILHYADPQAGGYEPTNPETGQCGKNGSIREIHWHAPAIRLINPRFLFDTGDELDNPYYAYSITNYQKYIEAMCQAGVPVLVTRGDNDDMISTEDWRRTIGIETYSLALGSFVVFQKDYNENHFSSWFTNAYAASFTNPAVGFRLFGQHFSDSGASWLPPAGQEPGLMLVGDIHMNAVIQADPYPIFATEAAHLKGAVSLVEFTRDNAAWACPTLTNLPAAQFRLMESGAVARISSTFAAPNDGSAPSNTAMIANQIPRRFRNGRLRFQMPFAPAGYDVSNGTVLAQYDYNEGSNLAVLVQVDIASAKTTEVAIQPSAAAPAAHGTPAWWLIRHKLPPNADGEDFDEGDGSPAWQEFIADTDPADAESCFRITGAGHPPSGSLEFDSSSSRWYQVLGCSNLPGGVWSAMPDLAARPGAGGPDAFSISNPAPYLVYRLAVTIP
ncbi:MAG: hypothetical protein EOM72_06420 [Opitutae bacterium]|nr:hypothetical protein [Opitutae bacterium]